MNKQLLLFKSFELCIFFGALFTYLKTLIQRTKMKLAPATSKRKSPIVKIRTGLMKCLQLCGFGVTIFTLSGIPTGTLLASEIEDSLSSEREREIEEIREKIERLTQRKKELLHCIEDPTRCDEDGYYYWEMELQGLLMELEPSE